MLILEPTLGEKTITIAPRKKYENIFKERVLNDEEVDLTFADFSIGSSSYLKELLVTRFVNTNIESSEIIPLVNETNIMRDRFLIDLSRSYDWGKSLRWSLQKMTISENKITRNNAMRSPFERLKYYSSQDTDILQEYFIPMEFFVEFTDSLRAVVKRHNANLINCTIRYINKAEHVRLNYAKNESFAFVLYFNVPKDSVGIKSDREFTRHLVNVSNVLGGTFYLSYLPHYDIDQIRIAYPEIDEFFQSKNNYDAGNLFKNKFYKNYRTGTSSVSK